MENFWCFVLAVAVVYLGVLAAAWYFGRAPLGMLMGGTT